MWYVCVYKATLKEISHTNAGQVIGAGYNKHASFYTGIIIQNKNYNTSNTSNSSSAYVSPLNAFVVL